MTPETFTAEQLLEEATIIVQRIPLVCDCLTCTQERLHASMLVYAITLLEERAALLASIDMLLKEIDRVGPTH